MVYLKKILLSGLLGGTFALLSGCSSPPDLIFDNPRDKYGTEYVKPEITSLNFFDLDTRNPTIKWSGNPASSRDYHYEYKIENEDWITYTDTSITMHNLDEKSYDFSVRLINDLDTSIPKTDSFEVDAIKGPGIVFSPREITGMSTISVYFEEVNKLMGAHIEIICKSDCAYIDNYKIDNFPFLATADTVTVFTNDQDSSRLIIDLAYLGGSEGISGSYKIMSFTVIPQKYGEITIDSTTVIFKDVNNTEREINGLDWVIVKK